MRLTRVLGKKSTWEPIQHEMGKTNKLSRAERKPDRGTDESTIISLPGPIIYARIKYSARREGGQKGMEEREREAREGMGEYQQWLWVASPQDANMATPSAGQ